MKNCPECGSTLYDKQDGRWIVLTCWVCGHYESNSPAFKTVPDLFGNMLRENNHALSSDESKQEDYSDWLRRRGNSSKK